MNQVLQRTMAGAASGFVATIPMSAVMLAGLPFFPRSQRRLPPKEITWNLAGKVRMRQALQHPDRPRSHVIATLNHFGYGTAVGAIYPWAAQKLRAPAVAKGMGFGLLVWAVSYLGWLPAADVRHSSLRDAPTRNIVMIAAHLVWGGSLAWLYRQVEPIHLRPTKRQRAVSSSRTRAGRDRAISPDPVQAD